MNFFPEFDCIENYSICVCSYSRSQSFPFFFPFFSMVYIVSYS